ncbi:uncharacterized protein KGF55_003688 [Candida pseudojiufengensis]|uniref:uncharacterized protein n=1 Tax=Candida pseudojiufengensis TaxID=497109 RepID=UPI002224F6DA|nr:uncharacterized protein KGF55_003688 [Candida pseudojiufengensis]KAI5962612.1 hypothetical protein KGF55_003688 [Candida pseudojiufengensis]
MAQISQQPILEPSLIKDLSNHIYEKRKATAFQIESITKTALSRNDSQTIYRIINELSQITISSSSNSAKMGAVTALGSVSVALGSFAIAYFLEDILRPIFATFKDSDARVRYYATEALYNVAKISRGEILPFFPQIFDIIAILVSDTESSVKNAADILDRLIKDIISAKATNYVSILQQEQQQENNEIQSSLMDAQGNAIQINLPQDPTKAFQLPKFIPTLLERMYTIDPFTKKFLLSWLELFDDIPNLELISFLPSLLKPLINFILNGAPNDIKLETQNLLNCFLKEIKGISKVKIEIKRKRREQEKEKAEIAKIKQTRDDEAGKTEKDSRPKLENENKTDDKIAKFENMEGQSEHGNEKNGNAKSNSHSVDVVNTKDTGDKVSIKSNDTTIIRKIQDPQPEQHIDGEEIADESEEVSFGQDIFIDYSKIIKILLSFLFTFEGQELGAKTDLLTDSHETICDVQFIVLKWLQELIGIAPQEILNSIPECVSIIIKNIAITDQQQDYELRDQLTNFSYSLQSFLSEVYKNVSFFELHGLTSESVTHFNEIQLPSTLLNIINEYLNPSLDNELSKVTSLEWLIFIYEKNPTNFLEFSKSQENHFELTDLLKYDTSNEVILKVLKLLGKISESNQEFFKDFILKLIKLFKVEGHDKSMKVEFIVRKLCLTLNSEIIFTTLSDVLQQQYQKITQQQKQELLDEETVVNDLEFSNMMILTLNNILLTSNELLPFRKRLKNLDIMSSDDWSLFATLFQSWCFNAPSAIALCLLTSNYELSYLIIKNLSELEVTSQLLTQLDVLIQLLESPIFVKLRLQLLEPENYPFLYKTLYGILMILPQSSTFMSLRNRLTTIGFYQVPGPSTSSLIPSMANFNLNTSTGTPTHQNSVSGGATTIKGSVTNQLSLRRKRTYEMLEKFVNVSNYYEQSQRRPR